MSVLTLYVDEVMRTLSNDGQYPFVVNDKTVDIVRFALNTGFTDVVLDENTALRVMYQRPGETEVRAQTLTHYDTDGLRNYYDWNLLSADLAKKGTITVALCILRTGSELEEWHTTPCQISVLNTIHTDDSDEADETITPTVAERVAVLETMIQRVASGAPIVVSSTSAMTDTAQIYVLSTNGNWYYHNGTAWTAGGEYGAVATDTTLTQAGIPADAAETGRQIDGLKADLEEQGAIVERLNDGGLDIKDEVIKNDIEAWLTQHPEATTTVQDGSITEQKLNDDLKKLIDYSGFYNEITLETDTYINENGGATTYYVATVPKLDSEGNQIDIYADVDMDTSPLTYAQKNLTTLTTNTSLDFHESVNNKTVWKAPACIKNGEVIRESSFDAQTYPYVVYVGFDSNRNVHEYSITTNPYDMVMDGIVQATAAYYRLVENGTEVDVSNIGLSPSNLKVNPRMSMFTKSDGSVCFLACDGRENIDEGLTPSELAQLMISKGAVQGWNLDGGGSTSMVTKGSKINRNIDENGTKDRACHTTWNVGRKFENPAVQKAFAQVGIEKQRLIKQLATYFDDDSYSVQTDTDPLVLEAGSYYLVHALNVPTETSSNGFAQVLRKENSLVSRIYWMPYNSNIYYMKWTNGAPVDGEIVWSDWIKFDVLEGWEVGASIPTGSDFNNYITAGKYSVPSAAVANNIANIPTKSSGSLYVIKGNNDNVIIQMFFSGYAKIYNRRIVLGSSPSYGNWALYSEIRNLTGTFTTDANGVFTFSSSLDSSEVLSMRASGYILLPYKDGTAWKGKVLDTSLQPIANTSISVTAQYALHTYINDVTP